MTLSWTTTATFNPADSHDRWNNNRIRNGTYTGPVLYVAGGDLATLQTDFGFSRVNNVFLGLAWNGTSVRLIVWDPTNKKIVWYVPETGAEASGNLSAYVAQILVVGQ